MLGFIFDIDGTITEVFGIESPVDRKVIEKIADLFKQGHKIAFVTGRVGWWIENNLLPLLKEFNLHDKLVVSGAFGLYKVENGVASENFEVINKFSPYRKAIKDEIIEVAKESGIPVKVEEFKAVPETGEMWFEDRLDLLSIRTNHYNKENLVTEDKVYEITIKAVERVKKQLNLDSIDVDKSSIATAVKFKKLSKVNVARYVIKTLDPDDKVEKWYVFGDAPSDKDIVKLNPDKMTFVNVYGKASAGVLEKLEQLEKKG